MPAGTEEIEGKGVGVGEGVGASSGAVVAMGVAPGDADIAGVCVGNAMMGRVPEGSTAISVCACVAAEQLISSNTSINVSSNTTVFRIRNLIIRILSMRSLSPAIGHRILSQPNYITFLGKTGHTAELFTEITQLT
jgi:hypothetical protein